MPTESGALTEWEQLYKHARACGLSPVKAKKWAESQLKPKPRAKPVEEQTPLLFPAFVNSDPNYRG